MPLPRTWASAAAGAKELATTIAPGPTMSSQVRLMSRISSSFLMVLLTEPSSPGAVWHSMSRPGKTYATPRFIGQEFRPPFGARRRACDGGHEDACSLLDDLADPASARGIRVARGRSE